MSQIIQDKKFMMEALLEAKKAQARGDIPVGAVVVRNGEIVSRAGNCRHSLQDPVGHAEVIAIQKASKKIGSWRCDDCTLYVTLEPCLMCVGAIINSRIKRLVYGANDERFGAFTLYNIDADNRTNHKFESTSAVLKEECLEILQAFFKKLR